MEASLALAGQTVGLIHEVLPVADIIRPHGRRFSRHPQQGERSAAEQLLTHCWSAPLQ